MAGGDGWTERARLWAKAPHRRDRIKAAIHTGSRLVPRNALTLRLAAGGARAFGWKGAARMAEGRRLAGLARKVLGDLPRLLEVMGQLEATGRPAPLEAGRRIADLTLTEDGRAELSAAAQTARRAVPDSAWLTHVVTLCQAMAGDYRAAGQDLARRLSQPFPSGDPLARSRFEILRNSWRITDQAARESMDWVDEPGGYGELIATPPPAPGQDRPLGFKEHLLQGRMREAYLAACLADFEAAAKLDGRLNAISDMMRVSLRHSPSYTESYRRAAACLDRCRADIDALIDRKPSDGAAESAILTLGRALGIARKLDEAALVARIAARFETLAEDPRLLPVLWTAPAAMAEDPDLAAAGTALMTRIRAAARPQTSRDVRGLFRWALLTNEDTAAEESFAHLSPGLRRQPGATHYVQILIRQGRFAEADEILADIHAQTLTHPARLNAFSSRSMIKRRGELAFLLRTAEILGQVPQPTAPRGILLLTARNIDALRRAPLMVLREMKREGWAVVPLFSGLLPPETTGVPEIDVLNGAISPNLRLDPAAETAFPALEGFEVGPDTGHLAWSGIDLSHPLWEDAAIARRRYHIDWTCPEMRSMVTTHAARTKAVLRALEHARGLDLPVATLTNLPARLPDAAVRFYCEQKGDPERFYMLHGANGYQNYFTNFATNVSQRFVLRNMTAHPETRAASMPVPEHFERYYTAAASRLPAIRARFAATPATPRSTLGEGRPPEAQAFLEELSSWRAGGGRVACAFGKVVCDSSVPFDGGPAHASMEDWITHACAAVARSRTMLLIKPHPHELNDRIATFPTELFADLLPTPLPENVSLLGHRWFDIADIAGQIDLGVVYNGTTAVELGLMGVPCLLSGHFAPIDYPIGHVVPQSRAEFEAYLRFEQPATVAPDLADRAAVWLDYMASEHFTLPYRYHVRTVTNTVLYPPWWYEEDLATAPDDPAVAELTARALNRGREPGAFE